MRRRLRARAAAEPATAASSSRPIPAQIGTPPRRRRCPLRVAKGWWSASRPAAAPSRSRPQPAAPARWRAPRAPAPPHSSHQSSLQVIPHCTFASSLALVPSTRHRRAPSTFSGESIWCTCEYGYPGSSMNGQGWVPLISGLAVLVHALDRDAGRPAGHLHVAGDRKDQLGLPGDRHSSFHDQALLVAVPAPPDVAAQIASGATTSNTITITGACRRRSSLRIWQL